MYDFVVGIVRWLFSDSVALAAITSAIVSTFLWRETVKLRRLETDPDIAVYLDLHPPTMTSIDLVLKNIGRGPAYDLTFHSDSNPMLFTNTRLMDFPLLRDGIRYMPPGQELRVFLGTYSSLPKTDFSILALYDNREMHRSRLKDGQPVPFSEKFTLSVFQFDRLLVGGDQPLVDIAHRLKEISDSLRQIKDPRHRVKVHISGIRPITPPDRFHDGEIWPPTLFNKIYVWIEDHLFS